MLLPVAPGLAQMHPSQLPPLTLEGPYPRASERVIGMIGFPDHLHEYHWGGWTPVMGPDGVTVGPGSLCTLMEPVPRDGLVIESGIKRYGPWILRHHPGYGDCDMLPCVELLTGAQARMKVLLGFAPHDTLDIINPGLTAEYLEATGQGVWRLYQLDGNRAVIEPFAVLLARQLDGHGTYMLAIDWILRQSVAQPLPRWLHQGLVEYLGEDGIHLADFMAEFRAKAPVLMGPAEIDAILSAGLDPDPARDRRAVPQSLLQRLPDGLAAGRVRGRHHRHARLPEPGRRGNPPRPGRAHRVRSGHGFPDGHAGPAGDR